MLISVWLRLRELDNKQKRRCIGFLHEMNPIWSITRVHQYRTGQ
ncbi:unnamed protein product [Brassica oleracea var. botrytis]